MDIDHEKLRYISGPMSIAKLEGTVNNVKKEVLILGDIHYHRDQNECNSIDNVPIKNYLIDLFKKSENNIDFFLEMEYHINRETTPQNEVSFTDNYINQLRSFFKRNKNNFNKVRFHYSDIRNVNKSEFLMFVYGFEDSRYNNIISKLFIEYDDLLYLLYLSDEIKDYVNIIIKGLKLSPKLFKKLLDDEPDDSHKFLFIKDIHKILNKYNNKIIKNEIRKILKIITSTVLDDVNKLVKFIRPLKKKIEDEKLFSINEIDKNVFDLKKHIENVRTIIRHLFVLITDIYTLRRLLDKNYIKKSIIYVGGIHSRNLLNILISNFNFKVINKFSHSKDYINIDKKFLLKYFKNEKNKYNKKEYYPNFSKKITKQCVDIKKFKKPLI